MRIEIWLVNSTTKKKRLWGTVEDNQMLEWFLRFRFGVLEGGTSKTLKQSDLYAMAGFASIYLINYKEPKDGVESEVRNTETIYALEQKRTMKEHASYCLKVVSAILSNLTPYEKTVLKIK